MCPSVSIRLLVSSLLVVRVVRSLNPVQLCNTMDYSMPGSPVLHCLLELLKFMCIESVMPSNHLTLCHPFLLLPSIFPSIRDFSNESAVISCISISFSLSSAFGFSDILSRSTSLFYINMYFNSVIPSSTVILPPLLGFLLARKWFWMSRVDSTKLSLFTHSIIIIIFSPRTFL